MKTQEVTTSTAIEIPGPEVIREAIAQCRHRERVLEKLLQVSLMAMESPVKRTNSVR